MAADGRRQPRDVWPHTKLMDIRMSVMWQRWIVYVESIVTSVTNSRCVARGR